MDINLTRCQWHYPCEVILQAGASQFLPEHLRTLNIQNPLIVIDPFLLDKNNPSNFASMLANQGFFTFSDFTGNPCSDAVNRGTAVYNQHQCDGVVAIGGGSAIDTAKTIALVAKQSHEVWDFVDENDNYKKAKPHLIPPIIALPTTAGTGAEVGRAALITHPVTREKKIIFHPNMMPSLAILDPTLSLTCPPALTAATGMDALAHLLEAFCVNQYHPMADGIALEGMRLIHQNLLTAYHDGQQLEARTHMMSASLMGATAFQKGLGAIHSLSHPVGGLYQAHHGLLNAIFMPYVLRFNRSFIEEKMINLATYLGLSDKNFDGVFDWVQQLNQSMNIPSSIQSIGAQHEDLDRLAALAYADPSTPGNPRPLSVQTCKQLLLACYEGDLAHIKDSTCPLS